MFPVSMEHLRDIGEVQAAEVRALVKARVPDVGRIGHSGSARVASAQVESEPKRRGSDVIGKSLERRRVDHMEAAPARWTAICMD